MGASWTKILAHNIRKHGRPSSLLKAFNSYSIWTQVWSRVNDKTQANTPEGTQDRTANSTSAGCAGRCGRGQTPPRKRGGARQPWLRAQATLTPTASPVWAGKEWNGILTIRLKGKKPASVVWKTHKCSFCLSKQKATYNLWTHLSRDSSEDNRALSGTGPPGAPGVCTATLPRTERSFRLNQKHLSRNALQSLLSLPPVQVRPASTRVSPQRVRDPKMLALRLKERFFCGWDHRGQDGSTELTQESIQEGGACHHAWLERCRDSAGLEGSLWLGQVS